jgi:hypothetical protein
VRVFGVMSLVCNVEEVKRRREGEENRGLNCLD